ADSLALLPYATLFRSHLHFTDLAIADLLVVVVRDADVVAIGEMVHRRTHRAARSAEIIAIGIGAEGFAHAEPPPGLGLVGQELRSEEHTSELQSRENL